MRISAAFAGLTSAALIAAGFAGSQAAQADAALYVDHSSASCSDSGPGSQAEPFCSIQAAANAVTAGQTVDIEAGNSPEYREAVVISHSGTSTAPITFVGVGSGPAPLIYPASGVPITLSSVHDVDVSHLGLDHFGNADGLDATGAQDVALSNLFIAQEGTPTAQVNGITIDGSSAGLTVSRSRISETHGFGIQAQAGAQQIVVTTNDITAGGISLSGTPSADVTSNFVIGGCGGAIGIDDSAAAVVENNIGIAGCSAAGSGALAVAADSRAGVQADYNTFAAAAPDAEYLWGGQQYTTAAAFAAATGQGGHDIDTTKIAGSGQAQLSEGSPLIDSADCNAPGELSTDFFGLPRVDDPLVTGTGAGTCHADRGAVERQDTLSTGFTTSPAPPQGPAPVDLGVTAPSASTSPWNEPVTYTADFGDGGGPVQLAAGATATHTYTTPGRYTLTVTAADTGGSSQTQQRQVLVATTAAPDVTFTAGPWLAQTSPGPAIAADSASFSVSAGADDWELASGTINFGDGTSQAIGTDLSWNHVYPAPGTYTATLTETDLIGRTATATATITVGDEFQTWGPYVAYNSRDLGVDKVPAHAVIKLSMSKLQAAFSNVRAAYVNVTVRSPKASGSVTVYPDGTSLPKQASVQFQTGHAASNNVLATPGSDQVVDFYNGSSGAIDLTVATVGLETNGISVNDTYTPVGPVRVLATTPLAGGKFMTFTVAGTHGVPAGADAVVLNFTATKTLASGYLTAYADGTVNPGLQDADWATGQSVTGQVVVPLRDGKVALRNSSGSAASFAADLVGYYSYLATGSVFLPARFRLLDTLNGTGTGGVVAKIAPNHAVKIQVGGKNGIPASGICAAAVNLTASGASAGGSIVAYPDGTTRPAVTSLSYGRGSAIANATIVPVGSDGAIEVYNGGASAVNLIVDLSGFSYQYP